MDENLSDIEHQKTKQEKVHDDFEESVPEISADFAYWSKMPFWSLEEGIALLLGKEPRVVNWDLVQHYQEWPHATELSLNYAKLRDLVLRAHKMKEIEEQNTPFAFLEWADSRGIAIPDPLRSQVEYVQDIKSKFNNEIEDLLKSKDAEIFALQKKIQELEELVWEGFDETSSTHAKELAIAVKAHSAISKSWKKGMSIKKQISIWLDQNYPKLMNEEQERISKICNWQKSGGAPATPDKREY